MYLKPSECADIIKSKINMFDVLSMYVKPFEPKRNRIPCPLHNGQDNNFSFTDNGYCCFVCGEHGDIINFVMQFFSLGFTDSLKKLNLDFNLNTSFGKFEADKKIKAEMKHQIAKNEYNRAMKEKTLEELEYMYWQTLRLYKHYSEQVDKLKPVSPDIYPSNEFLQALHMRTITECELDNAFMEICQYKGGEIYDEQIC